MQNMAKEYSIFLTKVLYWDLLFLKKYWFYIRDWFTMIRNFLDNQLILFYVYMVLLWRE